MPNEIYHRSNWGNANAEGFGDVYFDAAATNKLYNHSDYYENSDGTDATLKDLSNKASIVLTPTAYSDGSLNTVIPPYQVLPQELVTNGDFSDGTNGWVGNVNTTLSVSNGQLDIQSAGGGGIYGVAYTEVNFVEGKKYLIKLDVISTNKPTHIRVGTSQSITTGSPTNIYGSGDIGIGSHEKIFTATATHTYLSIGGRDDMTTLVIDNVSVKEIQEADFDFSRGSSATRVNEQGLVEDVQILSGELVQNGDFEQIGAEEVTNGNFDTDSDWTKGTGWTIANGKATVTNSTVDSIYQDILDTSKIYKATFEITDITSGSLRIGIGINFSDYFTETGTYTYYGKPTTDGLLRINPSSGTNASIDNVSVKEVGQNWTINGDNFSIVDGALRINRVTNTTYIQQNVLTSGKKYKVEFDVLDKDDNNGTFIVRLGSNNVYDVSTYEGTRFSKTLTSSGIDFRIYSSSNNGVIYVDNISVVEVTDDTDLPRIDFTDGTGSLLLEPQRTNLITYSEDFSDSSWTKLGAGTGSTAIVTSDYAISPDGTQNASRLQCDLNGGGGSSSNQSLIYNSYSSSGSQALSIYMKSNNGENQTIYFANTQTSGDTVTVTSEWQRFTFTHSTSIYVLAVGLRGRSGGAINDTADILIWAAQTEVGDYATSYIPTSGSTVTRSADVANNSGNADLINSTEGVLYAEISALANDGTNRLISLSDGTADERLFLQYSSTDNRLQFLVKNGGSTQCNIIYDASDLTAVHKVAAKYKANDFALWVDGVEIGTDTSGNVASGLSKLQFDRGYSGLPFYGNVKCVAVFKEALTDEQLQQLTS